MAFSHWRPYDAAFPWAGADSEPEKLERALLGAGVRAAAIECGLSEPKAPARLLDAVEERLGSVTILVNNAAFSTDDGYQALDAATIDAHFAVNTRGAMLLTTEFARRFVPGGGDLAASTT